MLFASGSSVTVIVKVWACGMYRYSFIKGVDLPEGKRKRLETMAGKNAVRNTIGASHKESGRALFRGCLGTTAAMCRPCAIAGRAIESASPHITSHHHHTLSSSVIQYSDGKLSVPNECVLNNCASLYMFCNAFVMISSENVRYHFPDHQIWGRTTRFSVLVVRWSTASKC